MYKECRPSTDTAIYNTRAELIHTINIPKPTVLPQTSPATAGEKITKIFFCIKCFLFRVHWHVL